MTTLRPWPGGDDATIPGVIVEDASRLMRWRDQYLLCDSCVLHGGRRLDLLETNYADGWLPHDLGAAGFRIEAAVVFTGDQWRSHVTNFLAVLQAGGVYDLTLPNGGPIVPVAVQDWSWDDQHGPREGATFTVTWVSATPGRGVVLRPPQSVASALPSGTSSRDEVAAYDDAVGAPDAEPAGVQAAAVEATDAIAADRDRLNMDTVAGVDADESYVLAQAALIDAYPWPDNPPASWLPLES